MPTLAPEIPTQTVTENITLRYTRCAAAPTTSSLAAQLGYFEEEFKDEPGVTLSLASLSLDPKVNPTQAEQFSLRHAGTKSAWARAQGARLRVVAVSHLQSYYSLWTLAKSGIETVADLKGRRVGVSVTKDEETLDLARAGSLHSYEGALNSVGLTLADAKQVEVRTEKTLFDGKDDPALRRHLHQVASRELLARLTRGEVDVITGGFSAETIEQIGLKCIFNSRETTHAPAKRPAIRALVAHETLIEEKFDWVVRILARHLQAAAWARNHPREATELVAQDHRTTADALQARYPLLIDGLQFDLGSDKVESLHHQVDFYLRHGFIVKGFSAESWIDRRPLEAARALATKRGY